MQKLIIGLGNIGIEYKHTRHNIGFDIVDHLTKKHDADFSEKRYGHISRFRLKNKNLVVLKPNTYMNRSGRALSHWMSKLNISITDVLVVVDDIHLDFGTIRMRKKGSDGGHNGLSDIIHVLGHQNFPRLRFGIGADFPKGGQIDFVLGRWNPSEAEALTALIPYCTEMIESYCLSGIDHTMSTFNKK